MPATDNSALSQEWNTLQNNYEQYEKSGLLIKLTAVVLSTVALATAVNGTLISAVLLILWLQEGIFRTYQSRLGTRILRVEGLLLQGKSLENMAFQFHSEWLAERRGLVGMVLEYAKNSLRPTVAFPYVALLFIVVVMRLMSVN